MGVGSRRGAEQHGLYCRCGARPPMTRVFIDGAVGTTGLEIESRLTGRSEFELIKLSEDQRKNATAPPNVAEQIVHDAIDVAIERICKVFFCGGKYMPGQDERLDLWKLLEQFCKCENHEKLDYDMPIGSQAKEPEPVKKKSGPKM